MIKYLKVFIFFKRKGNANKNRNYKENKLRISKQKKRTKICVNLKMQLYFIIIKSYSIFLVK